MVAPTSTAGRPGVIHSTIGRTIVATIDPSDTKRVRATMITNAAAAISVGIGVSTPKTPLAVATPLPPLKRSQIG